MDELLAALDKAVADGNWKLVGVLGVLAAFGLYAIPKIKAITRKRAKKPTLEVVSAENPADRQEKP
jgi:hypothetical protein